MAIPMTALFAHQERLRARAMLATRERPFRKVIPWQTGAGKSLGAMAAAFTKRSSLFIVPKGLKAKWERDILKTVPYADLDAEPPVPGCSWTLLTKEEFKKQAPNLPYYDAVVVDEGHYFSMHTSQLHKALDAYLTKHRPAVLLLLSATPALSSPWSVYGTLRLCGFPVKYVPFRFLFFQQVKMGGRTVWVPKKTANARQDLANALAKVCDEFVTLEDLQDVPPQIFETVTLPMPPKLKKAIEEIEEWQPVVRDLREHQLCGDVELSGKLPALLNCLVDAEKAIVVCKYREEIAGLSEALREHYDDRVYQIHGDVADRDGQVQAFRAPGKAVLLCQAQCAVGWEAPECGLVVFWSRSWSYVDNHQALGRVQRANAIKRNAYVTLLVEGSVDQDVEACLARKSDFYGRLS